MIYFRVSNSPMSGAGHKRSVVKPPENGRTMPLALFECLQGLAECLVLKAGWQSPQM